MNINMFLCALLMVLLSITPLVCNADGSTPKIMVVIPEYHMDPKDAGRIFPDMTRPETTQSPRQRIPDPSGETAVIKSFIAAGFHIVDQEQIARIRYSDQVKAAINGEKDLAILLGQQFGADIMITGEALSQSTGSSFQGLFSSRARIEAKAIDLKSGRLLFTDGLYASAMDRSEIISEKNALQKAGEKIGELFVEKLKSITDTPSPKLQVMVTGLSFKDFLIYRDSILSPIKYVTAIEQTSFTNQQAFLVVEIDKDTESFARDIVTNESKQFISEIIDISSTSLTIAVKLKREGDSH